MFSTTKSHLLITVTLVVCLITCSLFADILNAGLSIREPDGDYFVPSDTVIATLTLTDDDDNVLRVDEFDENGLDLVELWVSGPRQDYNSVDPYTRYRILTRQNGFNERSGFDPESGEIGIVLPERMDCGGTYSVLFHCSRIVGDRIYHSFPTQDFQIGQLQQTFTQSNRYLTCNVCHENPTCGISASNDLMTCVICHARDYGLAWYNFIHTRRNHSSDRRDGCRDCHRASGGIDLYSNDACFSCHDMLNDHRNYIDDECMGCHGNECYDEHHQPFPRTPGLFHLLEPEDDAVIDTLTVELSWEVTRDDDNDDEVIYVVDIATERRFNDFRVYEAHDETSFNLIGLENSTDYWWRVRALDLNTGGSWSRRWQFYTSLPEPPASFGLMEPADGDTIGRENNFQTELVWQASVDPNPNDNLFYKLLLNITAPDVMDVTYDFDSLEDTTYHFNLMEFIETDFWEQVWTVEWEVAAYSEGDTIWCDSSYTFYIPPNPNSVREIPGNIPNNYSISDAYPNPFNSTFKVVIGLPAAGNINVGVFNLSGREVASLAHGNYPSGYHTLSFNPAGLSNGVYLISYDLSGRENGVLKVLLIK